MKPFLSSKGRKDIQITTETSHGIAATNVMHSAENESKIPVDKSSGLVLNCNQFEGTTPTPTITNNGNELFKTVNCFTEATKSTPEQPANGYEPEKSSDEKRQAATDRLPPYHSAHNVASSVNNMVEKATVSINLFNILKYCLILSLCGFPIGWDVGTSSSIISNEYFPYHSLSNFEFGLIISCFHVGCCIGCLSLGQIPTNLKLSLQLAVSIYGFGVVLEIMFIYITNLYIWGYVIGRFIGGIGCGGLGVIGPMYMNELIIGGNKKRLFLSFHQTMIAGMILVANFVGWLSVGWPNLIYLFQLTKILYLIIFHLLIWFLPNSIKFFIIKKDLSQLWSIYNKLINNLNQSIFSQIITTPLATNSFEWRRLDLEKLIICCLITISQQFTGINYFFYYGSIIFKSPWIIVVLCLVNLLASISSGWLMNKYSLKHIVILCSFLMSADLIIYANIGQFTNISWLLITLSITFVILFAFSWGAGAGILVNIYSNGNPIIMSWAIAVSWLANWIITMITPWMINNLGFLYGYVFATSLILLGIFIHKFVC